jgi:hypothetical protein
MDGAHVARTPLSTFSGVSLPDEGEVMFNPSTEKRRRYAPGDAKKSSKAVARMIKSRILRQEKDDEQQQDGEEEAVLSPATKHNSSASRKSSSRLHTDRTSKSEDSLRRRSKSIGGMPRLGGTGLRPGLETAPSGDAARRLASSSNLSVARDLRSEPVSIEDDIGVEHVRDRDKSWRAMPLGPRTATTSDILAILSPRKMAASPKISWARNSPPSTPLSSEELFQSVDFAMDLAERSEPYGGEGDVPSQLYGQAKSRNVSKRMRRSLTLMLDNRDSPSLSPTSNNQCFEGIVLCHHCAASLAASESEAASTQTVIPVIPNKVAEQLENLQKRLTATELELEALVEASHRNERQFYREVSRFKSILGSMDQAQEVMYQTLLDVFTDNFKTIGAVEAQFEAMLGTRQRQLQTSSRGQLTHVLWFLVDLAVKALVRILRAILACHTYLNLRRVARHLSSQPCLKSTGEEVDSELAPTVVT